MQYIIPVIAVVLFVGYAVLLLYYRLGWQKIPAFPDPVNRNNTTRVSIIIPARNEEANIKRCLDSMLCQDYPENLFEVLVVDDHSTDNTAYIVQSFQSENIQLIPLSEYLSSSPINSYKKKAIEIAISVSSGDLIVTTDADCFVYPSWLRTIVGFYEKYQPAFIASPVSIDCGMHFIEIFQALDFMSLQGITGAAVHGNLLTMCNGANLAYEKKAFYEVDGFNGIDSIASGDDMLLMHKIYRRYPERIMFLKSFKAIVKTAAQKTIKAFFNQRIRWASKADKYDDKRILPVLMVVFLFNLVLLLMPVTLIIHNYKFIIMNFQLSLLDCWLILLFLKTAMELFFLFPVARFFGKTSLLWFFPLMQPFHILYTVIAGFLGKTGSYQWKDRKVL